MNSECTWLASRGMLKYRQHLNQEAKAKSVTGCSETFAILDAMHLICAGLLTDQSLDEFATVMHNCTGSHIVFASAVTPILKDSSSSSYLIITGSAGELAMKTFWYTMRGSDV